MLLLKSRRHTESLFAIWHKNCDYFKVDKEKEVTRLALWRHVTFTSDPVRHLAEI